MKHINLILIALVAILSGVALYPKSQPETVKPVIVAPIEVIDNRIQDVQDLARANGFEPSDRIVKAILKACDLYQIDAMELTAIGIIETGLGKYATTRKNTNGTKDHGVFQINTVNAPKCVEYNLDSPEGSALCAAKLLSEIKSRRKDYLGVYHSKTCRPDFCPKKIYMAKVSQVLASASDK